ncbi:hypothetical protein [Nostoc sp. PCC 7107]|uniref:hypothetical protein n=1 Tax=Nostoc sp. PCC 7107 TaxID=317936 RepID=UPI0002EC25AA|nr:hypothetical protein [Nostoc sp. PCC 7107]
MNNEKQEIENQVSVLIHKWRNLDLEAREVIENAIAKFSVATDTRQKLSKLIDKYPNITGNNCISLTGLINFFEQKIKSDKTLSSFLIDVVNGQSNTLIMSTTCT